MLRKAIPAAPGVLLFLFSSRGAAAESLRDKLTAAKVPIGKFTVAELDREITSYAIAAPFEPLRK
jgi:hypothetical protein